jgi:hypothetical protein
MPDKTFPNAKIVFTILTCIDRLPFEDEHVEDPELFDNMERCLKMYKKGVAPNGYKECQ